MTDHLLPEDEPIYVISVAARLVCLHPQTLRYYDRIGLMRPTRTTGRTRLYSRGDIERLKKISRLTDDLGANLAGVEVILNMSERIEALQQELDRTKEQAEQEIARLKQRLQELRERAGIQEHPVINVSARDLTREITTGNEEDAK
jgi:MerR family transcriptional regulator/heat shock protein HspR